MERTKPDIYGHCRGNGKAMERIYFKSKKMSKRNSKGGWILYLMVHVPFILLFKIGITSVGVGVSKRAKQVDRAVIGFPFPIMVLFIPGAYRIEQNLHRRFSWCHCKFYSGDGASEWFFLFPILLIPVMLCVWLSYLFAIDLVLGTDFFGVVVGFLLDVFHIIYIYLQQK